MTGTLINTAAVLVGSSIGLAIGGRLPQRIRESVVLGLGFVTVAVGVGQAIQTQKPIVMLTSLILGVVIGEALRLHDRLDHLADRLRHRLGTEHGDFVTGFVTASLVFCVGPMTLLGTTLEGLGDPAGLNLLLIKSALDFFASIAFAATFGVGVLATAGFVLVFQGLLTLVGYLAGGAITPAMQTEMVAVGGLTLIGLSLVLLGLREAKDVRATNFLPAVLLAPVLVALYDAILSFLHG